MPSDARHAFDVIIVGAGHNGLTAAAYLARAGLSTLVVERRAIVGGCCVTEEIAPGCRASTTSYIASMLRPELIRDLDLPAHGLRMLPCDPAVVVPFGDGDVLPWWTDRGRTVAELRRYSASDAEQFIRLDDDLKKLARYLQPFFLEPPPDVHATGLAGLVEMLKVGRRVRRMAGSDVSQMMAFLTGSLRDLLDRYFESDQVKTLLLANNVYGKHGGPYQPGSALGLLFHLLSGGDHGVQGYSGHVIGGMGAVSRALAVAARQAGAEIRTSSPALRIAVRHGRVRGVVLEDGAEIQARVVLSNADPKRTCLGLLEPDVLSADFRQAVASIKMNGPCAKVNMVLDAEPQVKGMWGVYGMRADRAVFTLAPSLEGAERCYDTAKLGAMPDELWVDCVVASNVDETLAPPGRHVMTCFVQYVPYRLREGTWDEKRELLGERVVRKIAEYAPNVPAAIVARQVLTPVDLEREYGLTEGNIFHGDLSLDQLFFMRPVPGWSRYRLPIAGLYLCGAGAHPGGGVTGAPGYNAARQVLADLKKWRV
ncbi:MAG: FAD-dependent oxidoreductase [Luteitalea sp.]|nr:FAD-dependent oxidoreductase [Luteitalea sp.]